jgi:hypothetical protein
MCLLSMQAAGCPASNDFRSLIFAFLGNFRPLVARGSWFSHFSFFLGFGFRSDISDDDLRFASGDKRQRQRTYRAAQLSGRVAYLFWWRLDTTDQTRTAHSTQHKHKQIQCSLPQHSAHLHARRGSERAALSLSEPQLPYLLDLQRQSRPRTTRNSQTSSLDSISSTTNPRYSINLTSYIC